MDSGCVLAERGFQRDLVSHQQTKCKCPKARASSGNHELNRMHFFLYLWYTIRHVLFCHSAYLHIIHFALSILAGCINCRNTSQQDRSSCWKRDTKGRFGFIGEVLCSTQIVFLPVHSSLTAFWWHCIYEITTCIKWNIKRLQLCTCSNYQRLHLPQLLLSVLFHLPFVLHSDCADGGMQWNKCRLVLFVGSSLGRMRPIVVFLSP